ncbi:MAG: UDP-N-acetylenolpyruvoylglucosamine reductase [Aquifex sp.]|nr:MAG: UDP-N-acetylenolpyruvoylglucosamine reductase [Aquifex sp.]
MHLKEDFPLKELTTIRVGGTAKFYTEPSNLEELKNSIEFSQKMDIPLFILGKGSNTIFGNIRGLVVNTRRLKGIYVREKDNEVLVECLCGTPLRDIIRLSLKEKLKDFYKLLGFPASVGGAVAMNAGAFGVEISDFVKEVYFISWEGEPEKLKREEITFSYRNSPFPKMGVVYKVVLRLKRTEENIMEDYLRIRNLRREKQPINELTSGSTFKNPKGNYAGKLIEEAGLKGFRLRNIGFSEKHANFLINYGNASFQEVKEIIEIAKEKVFKEFGINLVEEVKLVEDSGFNGWKVL